MLKSHEGTQQIGDFLSKLVRKQEAADEEEEDKRMREKEEEEMEKQISRVEKALRDKGFVTKADLLEKQDSKETTHPIKSKPDEQQDIIQAAEDNKEKDEEKEVEKQENEEEEEKEEEEGKEREYPEVEKLKKQNSSLQKEITNLKKSISDEVQKQVETTLRKTGWKKEAKVTPRKIESFGVEETSLMKSKPEKEDLTKLSYPELRKLQEINEAGELPEEYRQLIQ